MWEGNPYPFPALRGPKMVALATKTRHLDAEIFALLGGTTPSLYHFAKFLHENADVTVAAC